MKTGRNHGCQVPFFRESTHQDKTVLDPLCIFYPVSSLQIIPVVVTQIETAVGNLVRENGSALGGDSWCIEFKVERTDLDLQILLEISPTVDRLGIGIRKL